MQSKHCDYLNKTRKSFLVDWVKDVRSETNIWTIKTRFESELRDHISRLKKMFCRQSHLLTYWPNLSCFLFVFWKSFFIHWWISWWFNKWINERSAIVLGRTEVADLDSELVIDLNDDGSSHRAAVMVSNPVTDSVTKWVSDSVTDLVSDSVIDPIIDWVTNPIVDSFSRFSNWFSQRLSNEPVRDLVTDSVVDYLSD